MVRLVMPSDAAAGGKLAGSWRALDRSRSPPRLPSSSFSPGADSARRGRARERRGAGDDAAAARHPPAPLRRRARPARRDADLRRARDGHDRRRRADPQHHPQRRRSGLLVGRLLPASGRSTGVAAAAIDVDARPRPRPSLSHGRSRRPPPPGDDVCRRHRHAGERPVRASTTTRRAAANARSSPSSRTRARAASCHRGTSRRTRRPSRSRRRCRRPDGDQQHAGRSTARLGGPPRPLRGVAKDVDLPPLPRRRRLRARDRA